MAPPFNLVAHFMLAGGFFYALTSFVLPFYATSLETPLISTDLAAIVHLFLLGFVMMIIFGAMYQLIPVILEIPLFSKDFAYIQFYIYMLGLSLMCAAFGFEENYFFLLSYGAMLTYISMFIFIINIFLTYKNITQWTLSAKFIFVSNIFLLIGVSLGFIAALNLQYGFLDSDIKSLINSHMVSVLVGYIMMSIMGVSLVLIPMFALSHDYKTTYIEKAFNIIIIGITLNLLGIFHALSIAFIMIAIGLFTYQIYLVFSARVRKESDYWSKNMVASFLFLIAIIMIFIFASIFSEEKLFMLGGYFLLFGFFANIIIGHIYKILPFLVWYQKFAPLVGEQKVPMLHDMVVGDIANKQFIITLYGTILTGVSLLFSWKYLFVIGALAMLVGAMMVIYNMYYTLTYKGLQQ